MEPGYVRVESLFVATIAHISDLHFGRPAVAERLDALKEYIAEIRPSAVAVSGDLTQRCTNKEFSNARAYLDSLGEIAPYTVIPGNHDIRWLGAVARNLGLAGLFREKAHKFKYSRSSEMCLSYLEYLNLWACSLKRPARPRLRATAPSQRMSWLPGTTV